MENFFFNAEESASALALIKSTLLLSLSNSNKSDLLKALISLGYSEKEAKLATKNASTNSSLEENIKVALKTLSS